MRLRAPIFVLAVVVTLSCDATSIPSPPPGIAPAPNVVGVTVAPPLDDTGKSGRSVRLAIALGRPFPSDAPRHVVLVLGGANDAEVAAIAHDRALADLRAREVPLVAWGVPSDAPRTIFAQPTVPLDAGRTTLVLVVTRQPPFVFDLDVRAEPAPAPRLWPIGDAKAGPTEPWTWCASNGWGALPEAIELAPMTAGARVVLRSDAPCIDVTPTTTLAAPTVIPPPEVGDDEIDPSPIALASSSSPSSADASCRHGEVQLGPLCARVDDDRLVLVGAPTPTLALGVIADQPIFAPIPPLDRFVVRALSPASTIDLALVVRDGATETPQHARVTLAAPHRHVVVNEVLGRPPSGASTQRFVELVNDGARDANLGGMQLRVGETSLDLPARTLPAGAFALVVPDGFVDGFGGDVPPAPDVTRIVVDALPATGGVSIVDDGGTILSTFPGSPTTRTASRGRRLPWTPDDAPDAFGFDANDRATPGAANTIE